MVWWGGKRKAAEAGEETETAASGVQWSMRSTLVTRGVTGLLWVALACGPIALAAWAAGGRTGSVAVAAPAAVRDDAQEAARAAAEEFAVRVVTVWLSAHRGQEELVGALLPQAGSLMLPKVGLDVSEAMVASSVPADDGVWTVTVAAQVSDSRMSARRFFALPVKVSGSTVVAVSLPGERPGPQVVAAGPALNYPEEVDLRAPLAAVASDFLAALIAGQGDVQRLVSPEADIRPVMPAPFTSVKVDRVVAQHEVPESPRDGTRLEVMVTAVAQVDRQRQVVVQYPLTVTVRAGRWEVLTIRDVPLLSTKTASAVPSASPAPAESLSPSPSPSGSASPTRK